MISSGATGLMGNPIQAPIQFFPQNSANRRVPLGTAGGRLVRFQPSNVIAFPISLRLSNAGYTHIVVKNAASLPAGLCLLLKLGALSSRGRLRTTRLLIACRCRGLGRVSLDSLRIRMRSAGIWLDIALAPPPLHLLAMRFPGTAAGGIARGCGRRFSATRFAR